MKNDNYKQHKTQNMKFEKKVNHMSSFIGMPMWNGHNPSLTEIREYDRRLLEKQALGFGPERKSFVSRLFNGLISIVSIVLKQLKKAEVKITEKKEPVKISPECC
ncbi:MAG: hypothetical protein V7749_11525 [Cocleimonas sp.]